MAEGPLNRIIRDAEVADLVELLAERLTPTDLQSLMLEVYRRRAAQVAPAELLATHAANRFTRPSDIDPAAIARFEQLAWSLLPDGYHALDLSPLCPLGTNSVIATVGQNKVVSTARNTEVVADVTNVLALECAIRRRHALRDGSTRARAVRLAASLRQVRAQAFGGPDQRAHFRIIGLVAAGRDTGSFRFESDALKHQIAYLVALVARARPEWRVEVAVTDLASRADSLQDAVVVPLAGQFPEATFQLGAGPPAGGAYYVDACYKLYAATPSGVRQELADGGCTTWVRQLLSDQKEKLVIGGLGFERVIS